MKRKTLDVELRAGDRCCNPQEGSRGVVIYSSIKSYVTRAHSKGRDAHIIIKSARSSGRRMTRDSKASKRRKSKYQVRALKKAGTTETIAKMRGF